MRLFIALELPEALRRHLSRHVLPWREKRGADQPGQGGQEIPRCSWVREENLHVTVKFLGQVAEDRLQEVCDALSQVRPRWPLRLVPSRIECLPPSGLVRVIAVGLEGDLSQLHQLHGMIEEACVRIGIPREGRLYRPHITLARASRPLPRSMRATLIEQSGSWLPAAEFTAERFVLMESRLRREGAQYVPLAMFGGEGESEQA